MLLGRLWSNKFWFEWSKTSGIYTTLHWWLNSRDPDSVLLLSSQMRSQLICFESVPKIVTLTDHWVQFNSLNSIWQQLLLLLSVNSKDLGWNFFKNHNKLCYDFFFLVGYYQTHFCPCENVTKTSSSKKPEWLIS